MKVTLGIIYFLLIMHFGVDYAVHITNAHYFNYMIAHGFTLYNPNFNSGKQYVWAYGIFANLISGLFYFVFGKFTVKILEIVLFTIVVFVANKHIRNKLRLTFFLLCAYIILPYTGAYLYLFSMTVFILGYYSRNKKTSIITKIIAGLNHVFFTLFNFYYFRKNKKLLALTAIIFAIQVINIWLHTQPGDEALWLNAGVLGARASLNALLGVKTSKKKLVYFASACFTFFYLLINLPGVFVYAINIINENYYDLPHLNGTARFASYSEWSGLYEMQLKNVTLSTPLTYHEQTHHFKSEEDYLRFLSEKNVSYVILDKNIFGSYEHKLLEKNFNKLIKNDRYILYEVKS